MRPLLPALIGLALVALLCVVLQYLFPPRGVRARLLRPGWRVDLTYALAAPLGLGALRRFTVALALVPVALLLGHGADPRALIGGHGPLALQPHWLQGLEMLVLADFIGYWEHRAFHGRTLWPVHAVHHSSPHLDWLAAFRVHPLNDIAGGLARAVPLVVLGFAPATLAGVLPILTLHAILLHADLDWDFGRLRHVISSPAFHRWHHTAEAEGRDRNFAGLLPVWDLLFGTFWMPGRRTDRVGIDAAMAPSWIGQIVWPFLGRRLRALG